MQFRFILNKLEQNFAYGKFAKEDKEAQPQVRLSGCICRRAANKYGGLHCVCPKTRLLTAYTPVSA